MKNMKKCSDPNCGFTTDDPEACFCHNCGKELINDSATNVSVVDGMPVNTLILSVGGLCVAEGIGEYGAQLYIPPTPDSHIKKTSICAILFIPFLIGVVALYHSLYIIAKKDKYPEKCMSHAQKAKAWANWTIILGCVAYAILVVFLFLCIFI